MNNSQPITEIWLVYDARQYYEPRAFLDESAAIAYKDEMNREQRRLDEEFNNLSYNKASGITRTHNPYHHNRVKVGKP